MALPRQQPMSSPRFSRGLALLCCVSVAALLAAVGLRQFLRHKSPVEATAPVMAEIPQHAVENEAHASVAALSLSARRSFWEQTFARIEDEADDDRREALWSDFAAQMPIGEIPTTLDELQSLGYGENELVQRLVRRWAKAEIHAAAAWSERLPAGAARQSTLEAVAIEWAGADLNSAAAWARQLPDASEQQTLLLAVANESVRRDPLEALRLAAELPPAPGRDEMVRRAVMEWTLSDASAAVDWASLIPDTTLREQVMASAATAWAESAPDAAAKLAVENLPAGRLLDDTVVAIVQRWAQQQPEVAATWVESFPGGSLRVAAIENLVAQWSQIDEEGAKRWQAAHL